MAFFESNPDRKILHEKRIVSSWSTVIPEGAGKGESFFEGIERAFTEFGFPEGTLERKELMTIMMNEIRYKDTRVCLCMSRLGYDIFFSTQDYGKHIILSQLVGKAQPPVRGVPVINSQFQKEELGACLTFVNAARTMAAKKLAEELKQDVSKINMEETKGVIDIA